MLHAPSLAAISSENSRVNMALSTHQRLALLLLTIVTIHNCGAQKESDDDIGAFDTNTEEIMNMKADDNPQATTSDSITGPPDLIENIRDVAPDASHAVWDATGKICLLAKFQATFTITYSAVGGDQVATVKLPEVTKTKGTCGTESLDPVVQLLWPSDRPIFELSIFFSRIPATKKNQPDTWAITAMELKYNTKTSIFIGAINAEAKTARLPENTTLFETQVGKSYFCNSPLMIHLINPKKERSVSAKLTDVRVQPFAIKNAKFSPPNRCSSVRIGSSIPEPYDQDDESVPILVGSIMAVMAVLVVVGYALYKSITVRRVDYNTMD